MQVGCAGRAGVGLMPAKERNYSTLVKTVREQLGLSQEDLARELGVSFASVNRWENGQAKPSKLARVQLDAFCTRMIERGTLKLPDKWKDSVA
jgi:ribosome-binding protein aMBF1 (putative translation factor)